MLLKDETHFAPAHASIEGFYLGQRCPRDSDEAHVVVVEMNEGAVNVI